MGKDNRHVVKNPKAGWDRQGGRRQAGQREREDQAAAERPPRRSVGNAGGGEAVIHGRDGRIRDTETVAPGRDLNPPKDTRH